MSGPLVNLTKVVVLGKDAGPVYTKRHDNHTMIQKKALAFRETYNAFVKAKDVDAISKPANVDPMIFQNLMKDLYKNKQNLRWLVKLVDRGLNPLFCSEDDVREMLRAAFDEQEGMREKSTFQKNISQVRAVFRAIGREHAWGEGQIFRIIDKPLVDSSNPMTTASEKALLDAFKDRRDKGKNRHEGFPASVALFYVVTIIHMSTAMADYMGTKINQVERIINLCNLVFLNVLMMHEAGRPGDSHRHMVHQDITLPLHRRIYALTLVFLKPATLAHLIQTKAITHFIVNMYKGKPSEKKPAFYVERVKTVIPPDFNSLDLLMHYVLMTKMCVSLDPDMLAKNEDGKWLVFKQVDNYSSLNARRNKALGLGGFVSYSARYAAAAEDKAGRVDESWTRARMGHTTASNTKDMYADIRDDRVLFVDPVTQAETRLALGTDGGFVAPSTLPMEFNRTTGGIAFQEDWLDVAFEGQEEMKEEFEEVATLVEVMLDKNDAWTRNMLLRILEEQGRDWLHDIPMGFKVKPAMGLVPESLQTKFEEAVNVCVVNKWLSAPKSEGLQTVELRFFAQTLYGRWSDAGLAAAARGTSAPEAAPKRKRGFVLKSPAPLSMDLDEETLIRAKEQLERMESEKAESEAQAAAEAAAKANDKRLWHAKTKTAYFAQRKKQKVDPTPLEDEDDIEDDWIPADIEVGDLVLILCTRPDKPALKVRGKKDAWAWVVEVTKAPTAKGDLKGTFYYNSAKDMGVPLNIQRDDTVQVNPQNIITIVAAADINEALLAVEEDAPSAPRLGKKGKGNERSRAPVVLAPEQQEDARAYFDEVEIIR